MEQDNDRAALRPAQQHVEIPKEPNSDEVAPDLRAELDAAYARLLGIEREADAKGLAITAEADRRIAALARERDEARLAQAAAEKEARSLAAAERATAGLIREAQERADAAEAIIRRLRTLPGLLGWLLRWLASDVLPD